LVRERVGLAHVLKLPLNGLRLQTMPWRHKPIGDAFCEKWARFGYEKPEGGQIERMD
jgi:hypothetical protein